MKFLNKKLIIFDLDGTLIDSVPDLAEAVNYTLTALNRPTFDENTIRFWVGNGAQTLVKRALSGKSEIDETLDEALFQEALAIFLNFYKKNLCKNTQMYPNVKQTLQTLKSQGYLLAIVTNKPFAFISPILQGLNLVDVFDISLGGDSLAQRKPSPEPLQFTCKKLGINVKNSVMVGDSKNDILAANATKMQSIAVSYGYNYGEDIATYNPDIVVDDFAHILESF